ncbi:MAG: 2OG-Fe(II) oxygenase [Burkholderiaceae bacterium]|nr:2OG-Fe(II) oxygenase [Burkholderiaceae bacterium]
MPYINPSLDLAALAEAFAKHKRVLIRDFFEPHVADAIARHLADQAWDLVFRDARGDQRLSMSQWERMDAMARGELTQGIVDHARQHFQFSFLSYAATNDAAAGDNRLLARMVRYMSSEDFLEPIRRLTGVSGINRLYAQATMYVPGSFLLVHDDEVEVEQRRVAYVLNLTRRWRPDWGGLLHFLDDEGGVAETYFPHFNSLSLFLVPQAHFVSYVPPFADGERCAITGWLIE